MYRKDPILSNSFDPSQPRDPITQQWVNTNTPPRVALSSSMTDAEYNAQGTFDFPVPARSAEQMIDFWTHVPISDESLSSFREAYKEDFMADEHVDAWVWDRYMEWKNLPENRLTDEELANEFAVSRWNRNKDLQLEKFRKEYPFRPYTIPPAATRQVARAGMLWFQSSALKDETEIKKITEYQIDFGNGDSPTVKELFKKYHLRATVLRYVGTYSG